MNFFETSKQGWLQIQHKIFATAVPRHFEWDNLNDIITVLNLIGSVKNASHMFYPTGGGMDIESAKESNESGCIEINTGLADVVKPKRLLFESFSDPLWNYFRLETHQLSPTGVYQDVNFSSEELIEISKGHYISRAYWDIGEYHGKKLPKSARVVTRHFKGSFVIFAKFSEYNEWPRSKVYSCAQNLAPIPENGFFWGKSTSFS